MGGHNRLFYSFSRRKKNSPAILDVMNRGIVCKLWVKIPLHLALMERPSPHSGPGSWLGDHKPGRERECRLGWSARHNPNFEFTPSRQNILVLSMAGHIMSPCRKMWGQCMHTVASLACCLVAPNGTPIATSVTVSPVGKGARSRLLISLYFFPLTFKRAVRTQG